MRIAGLTFTKARYPNDVLQRGLVWNFYWWSDIFGHARVDMESQPRGKKGWKFCFRLYLFFGNKTAISKRFWEPLVEIPVVFAVKILCRQRAIRDVGGLCSSYNAGCLERIIPKRIHIMPSDKRTLERHEWFGGGRTIWRVPAQRRYNQLSIEHNVINNHSLSDVMNYLNRAAESLICIRFKIYCVKRWCALDSSPKNIQNHTQKKFFDGSHIPDFDSSVP